MNKNGSVTIQEYLIKLFWYITRFNKKKGHQWFQIILFRQNMMLEVLSRYEGVAVTWDLNAKQFIAKNRLQLIGKLIPCRRPGLRAFGKKTLILIL
jgi:hypothetical protein